jgi:hypothetical protein
MRHPAEIRPLARPEPIVRELQRRAASAAPTRPVEETPQRAFAAGRALRSHTRSENC